MEVVLVLLVLYLILKESKFNFDIFKRKEEKSKLTDIDKQEIKKAKEHFNSLMNYSIEQAIASKRGDR